MSPLASLRGTPADPKVVDALERSILQGSDDDLCRINALAFAREHGLAEDTAIDALLRASRLGLFDLSWATSCPGCGGIIEDSDLKDVTGQNRCDVCELDYDVDLDERVEVTFTVHPRVRRIHAHDPETLSAPDSYRLMHVSSRFVRPTHEQFQELYKLLTYFAGDLPLRERRVFDAVLRPGRASVTDASLHRALHIDVAGEPTTECREIEVTISDAGIAPKTLTLAPGPAHFTVTNLATRRLLVAMIDESKVGLAAELRPLQPYLTAKRLFSNQTFRELYRTDEMVSMDQRLRITSLTFVFTDLKGSTELYERVGDLAAYDLVRHHFEVLTKEVRTHGGAVVKTIGDAVMATFPTADRALAAALQMRAAMDRFNAAHGREELVVKIGVHEGPCLAVVSNERLDYFGQTVNIAARVQGVAASHRICTTAAVVKDPAVARILEGEKLLPTQRAAKLKGISDDVTIYEIA